MRKTRFWCLVVLGIWLQLTGAASGAEVGDRQRERSQGVVFDHLAGRFQTEPFLRLRDGEVFFVVIENTSPAHFIYEVKGQEKEVPSNEKLEADDPNKSLVAVTLPVRHESRFGGYIVRITSKTGAPVAAADKRNLEIFELEVPVETLEWDYEFAGAFTVSDLTDPTYSLQAREVDGGEEQMFIVRDRDAEDRTKLGIGAFTHLFHTRLPAVALSFGLGINEDNKTTYFVGPSWRWGGKGALTAGVAFGSVARLPAGARENERATNTNVLSELGSKTANRYFLSFSYSFLGNMRDRFEKPFAGAGNSPSAGGGGGNSQKTILPDVRNLSSGGDTSGGGQTLSPNTPPATPTPPPAY